MTAGELLLVISIVFPILGAIFAMSLRTHYILQRIERRLEEVRLAAWTGKERQREGLVDDQKTN